MALTGIQIYKHLPRTNCKDCGLPTCLAFAMKLSQKQVALEACPHVSDEAKALLAEESAPPIRLVKIGTGERELKIGDETVLFRHEKTFYHPPGLTLLIEDNWSDEKIADVLAQVKEASFERVGQKLEFSLLMLINKSGDKDKFLAALELIQSRCDLPLVLSSPDAATLEAALSSTASGRPLIYAATEANYTGFAALAKKYNCPLAAADDRGLDKLAELAEKLMKLGVKDIVLDPGVQPLGRSLSWLTQIRRAALKKTCKSLGFPVMVFAGPEGISPMEEAQHAAVYIMRYASVIVLRSAEAWKMLPLFTLRLNIYTDPQQPLQVEEKIYKIGEPTAESPIIITTNFSLTYFIVAGEIENSRVPTWMLVADVEGLSVLTAWAADKFNAPKIAKVVTGSGIKEQTTQRKLILPGYVAILSGEVAEMLPDWQIVVGPREAGNLPTYLKGLT